MKRAVWIGLALGLFALAWPLLYPVYLIHSTRKDNEGNYERHRDRYEAILATLKKLEVPERRMAFFFVAENRDPSSLRPLKEMELNNERHHYIKSGRHLDVVWHQDGALVATFYNKDLGAFGGTWVTIHSPVNPNATQVVPLGSFKQVAPNWWAGHID
ncbi:MAG TPA: hypothetical protein VF950_19270 [Planctomycetota bacterium]